MEKYKSIHGFKLERVAECPDVGARFVEYVYERTGTPLYYLDRTDANMTFAIGFRTVPTDDTGVYHIIEHSVLCGSDKFPVKDPFTELLKGSITTFLNAFTYGEKTVYPFSTKNKRAFMDLLDVYMDAVLFPNATKNPCIFMQEGHRLEYDADGRLTRNGVVYNEMLGAYSSPDELMGYYEGQVAFPGGCYCHDSGGNPSAIPTLTYEKFCDTHRRLYHPSNALICLDGEVELERVLERLDSILSSFDMGECYPDIPEGEAIITEPLVKDYPVASAEECKDKTRISIIKRLGGKPPREVCTAVALVTELLSESNNSPLKRRVLDSGLCSNFTLSISVGIPYPTLTARFTDVRDGCEEELISVYKRALEDSLAEGLDKIALEAAINSAEFTLREADFGSYPRGIVYMQSIFEDAMYGFDAAKGLEYTELFGFLREKIDTPYYIDTFKAILATDEATVILHPSATLEAEQARLEKEALDRLEASLTDAEREKIRKDSAALSEWQGREDSDEALATIPELSLSDLTDAPEETPTEIYDEDGVRVISHPIESGGITYAELYFDVSDLTATELSALSLLPLCISDLDTLSHSANDLRQLIKATLGSISIKITPIKSPEGIRIYLNLSISVLDRCKSYVADIMREYLYERIFGDEPVELKMRQSLSLGREYLAADGSKIALSRGAAQLEPLEAVKEIATGIEALLYTKRQLDTDTPATEPIAVFRKVIGLLSRGRLTVGITGAEDRAFVRELISAIAPGGERPEVSQLTPLPKRTEGIVVSSPVSYAALVGNIRAAGEEYDGAMMTLATILDFEILWNEIRVKGGAYGAGFVCRANSGTTACYSYRDPTPERSVGVFATVTDTVRELLASGVNLTKFIIGTIGSTDSITTPRMDGTAATVRHLSGKSYADLLRIRQQAIDTTPERLLSVCDIIDKATAHSTVAVTGPKDKLEAMGLDALIEV